MYRTACFIKAFGASGEEVENRLFNDRKNVPGPFVVGQNTRKALNRHRLVGFATSKNFTLIIPIVFLAVFVVLFFMSFASAKAGTEGISDGEILGDRAARSGDLPLHDKTVLDSARQSGSRSDDPTSVQPHGPDKSTASVPTR
jgi:hypothetical protein